MPDLRQFDALTGEPWYSSSLMAHLNKNYPWRKDSDFMLTFSKLLGDIRKVANFKKVTPYILPGSSSFAVEFSVANLLEPDDVALVVGEGPSSEYIASITKPFAAAVDLFPLTGDDLNSDLSAKLEEKPYKVVLVPHVEMSTGILLPVEEIERIVREVKAFLIIDAHATIGAHPVPKADVITCGSNYGLGSPAGLSIIIPRERVLEERNGRSSNPPSRNLDMLVWSPVMENYLACEVIPPISVPTVLIHSLSHTVGEIAKDPAKYEENHAKFSQTFREAITTMDFELVEEDHDQVARTFTIFRLPEDIKPGAFNNSASKMKLRLDKPQTGKKDEREVTVGHVGVITEDDLINLLFRLECVLADQNKESKTSSIRYATRALHGKKKVEPEQD